MFGDRWRRLAPWQRVAGIIGVLLVVVGGVFGLIWSRPYLLLVLPGLSFVASTLWSLDYTLLLAQSGLSSVEFQGRIAGCAPYIPLCTARHSSELYARPEFYGLMAVQQLPAGPFLRLTDPDAGTLPAFALRAGNGALSIVLDNFGGPTTVVLRLPGARYPSARDTVLTTSSPLGLSATTGITLGGRRIGPGATLAALRYRPIELRGDAATVAIPAHTAVIVRVHRPGG